jgi:hypothetical protein
LIANFDEWPLGFSQFKSLDMATGYNNFFLISEYLPLTDISKKFNKIHLKKFIF